VISGARGFVLTRGWALRRQGLSPEQPAPQRFGRAHEPAAGVDSQAARPDPGKRAADEILSAPSTFSGVHTA